VTRNCSQRAGRLASGLLGSQLAGGSSVVSTSRLMAPPADVIFSLQPQNGSARANGPR
jgi:hypothetical protein